MMYIKRTYYSYVVYENGKVIREFATYSEALDYIKDEKEKNYGND